MATLVAVGPGAFPAAAGPPESTGYAAPSVPANIGDPGPNFMSGTSEHDVDEGVDFDGLEHYELKQGPHPEDKKKWQSTDYIKWTVQGATLIATGQVTDKNSADASSVSSEAWGMEKVTASVSAGESDWAEIHATNTIQFSWD